MSKERKVWDPSNPLFCDTFWGSHGCDLPPGHEGPCMCITIFYGYDGEEIERSEGEGNCGAPYFGPETEFFSLYETPTPPQTLAAARGEGVSRS